MIKRINRMPIAARFLFCCILITCLCRWESCSVYYNDCIKQGQYITTSLIFHADCMLSLSLGKSSPLG